MPKRSRQPEDARATIERSRREIDALDDQLVALLERRAGCALAIGRAKRAAGVPVRDAAREAAVLERVAARAHGPLDARSIERVFKTILDVVREVEAAHTEESRP